MAERMTDERLAEIRKREQAATEGPWWSDESDLCWRLHGVFGRIPPQAGGAIPEQIVNKQILKAPKQGTPYAEYWPDPADAEFIVHVRQDVRDLLDEVDRLRTESDLTPGQRAVLRAVREYVAAHGHAPSNSEICGAAHVSPASVTKHLRALHRAGLLRHHPGQVRGIELTPGVSE